jgi:Ca-activated chloride channel family protein
MMEEFHFLRPAWFVALIPMLFFLLWLHNSNRSRGVWQAVCDAHLIPYVLKQGSAARRTWHSVVLGVAGLVAVIALAGPVWQKLPQPVFRQQSALVVVLDLSKSMDAGDLKPSRLERARLKLIDLLRLRSEGQTALIVYAGDAFVVTPLTDDTGTITALVQSLSTGLMPAQGSNPGRAVRQALELLSQSGIRAGSILMITDGIQENEIDDVADAVVQSGHSLSVMGVGTAQGAPVPGPAGGFVKDSGGQIVIPRLDERVLRKLASQAGGVYTSLRIQDDDIEMLLGQSGPDWTGAGTESTELQTDRWREEGPWLLLLLLPVATLAFRKGLLVAVLCLGLHWPDPALALEWNDLWLNADQKGARAMAQEEFGAAADSFTTPGWKAAARYRSGEYEEAVAQLEGLTGPEATYNRGNALARLGRIEDAIESYEQTLALLPDHADASHNLDLLKQLQDQQQQQQSQQNGGDDNEQQQSDDEQGSPNENQSGNPGEADNENQKQADSGQSTEEQSGSTQQAQQPEASPAGEQEQSKEQAGMDQSDKNSDQQPVQQTGPGKDESDSGQQAQAESDRQQTEQQQAMEQWLRRVPDDPAGLLRRKFRYQYSQRDRAVELGEQQW